MRRMPPIFLPLLTCFCCSCRGRGAGFKLFAAPMDQFAATNPIYGLIIEQPVGLHNIHAAALMSSYASPDEVHADVLAVCRNATTFHRAREHPTALHRHVRLHSAADPADKGCALHAGPHLSTHASLQAWPRRSSPSLEPRSASLCWRSSCGTTFKSTGTTARRPAALARQRRCCTARGGWPGGPARAAAAAASAQLR